MDLKGGIKMPYINLKGFEEDKAISEKIVSKISEITEKPKKYIMFSNEENKISFNNKSGYLLEYRQIGELEYDKKLKIVKEITKILQEKNIHPEDIYFIFDFYPRENWGWNNKLFG
ncbi:MAG: Macrophage migration inhibitory factor [Geotoga sp.]|jgi:phenylpyruvate tautomerase PptA (4-oxalocrotonate tautomerase family)|nr:Macrophage migration inhibitory factor [Geotoga sp.]